MQSIKILIIDDEAGICETLVDILEAKGFLPVAVQTGRDGVKIAGETEFDVALIDLKLPDMDGFEVFKALRQVQPELICIFITGYASAQNAITALKQGAAGYYIKPLAIDELLHGIKEALEKRTLRENLADSESRYRELLSASKDAIVSVDDHGLVFHWNQAATTIFGYTVEEMMGRSVFLIIPERYRERHAGGMERVRENGKTIYSGNVFEVFGLKKDGTEVPLELSLSRWQTGRQTYFTGIVRDISERINLERQLRQAQKMEAIGTLAGGIAHDFNNLLSIIGGYTEMARRALAPDSEIYADLTAVANATHRATELVKQILTIARQSEGKGKKPLLLQSLLKETVKMLRGTIPTTIQFKIEINEYCRPIMADQSQIHQVLMNLATNAYHAMRDEGGILSVKLGEIHDPPGLPGGNYLCLEISDTGCGIEEHILERIFEPYFTTKKVGEGTGLGLATTHAIVQAHHGYIDVESEPGQGTGFRVLLPVLEEAAGILPAEDRLQKIASFDGMLLLVDDDGNILAACAKMLSVMGCGVETCHSGAEALKVFRADPDRFDLVITDFVMPEMDGLDLAGKMLDIRPELPVVMITGYNENINEEKARMAGVKALLHKPLDMKMLSDTLKKYLHVVKDTYGGLHGKDLDRL
ncbi:MAG: response regulator [Proteobacteria bacterium]|nr:response regulator [Pseudomonadota bacterium]MBU1738484.1 response regulator [Pseudomonadota bacterium]